MVDFWLCWVFVAARRLSPVMASGRHSSLQCAGFSLWWLLFCCLGRALAAWTSVVVARGLSSCGSWALECRLSSCAAWAYLLCGMWDLPGPGLEPVSPALAGGFLTTVSPGKSLFPSFCHQDLFKDEAIFSFDFFISHLFLNHFLYTLLSKVIGPPNFLTNRSLFHVHTLWPHCSIGICCSLSSLSNSVWVCLSKLPPAKRWSPPKSISAHRRTC